MATSSVDGEIELFDHDLAADVGGGHRATDRHGRQRSRAA